LKDYGTKNKVKKTKNGLQYKQKKEEQEHKNTSCNLTTLGCLRSFKVAISLFICHAITIDERQKIHGFQKKRNPKPRSESYSFGSPKGTHLAKENKKKVENLKKPIDQARKEKKERET
jgi:hypothetical protein